VLKSYAACQGAQIARLNNGFDSKQLTSVSLPLVLPTNRARKIGQGLKNVAYGARLGKGFSAEDEKDF
jgi:hypothetical protein